jgi:hypothetical protein
VSERIRRPQIERTEPLRSWQGVFGPPSSGTRCATGTADGGDAADPVGAADVGATAGTADGVGASRAPNVEQAVSRSVEIGYQVIDHYLRQGQEVARSVTEGRATTASLVRDTTDLSTRMVQYASDFVGTWMELLEVIATRGTPAAAQPARNAFEAPQPARDASAASHWEDSAPAAAARPTPAAGISTIPVVLAVRTGRPVEASLDLDASTAAAALRVCALRASEPRGPHDARIDAVGVEHAGGRTVVHLTIGDQPPGTYEGIVTDDTLNLPVGRVRLTIL